MKKKETRVVGWGVVTEIDQNATPIRPSKIRWFTSGSCPAVFVVVGESNIGTE